MGFVITVCDCNSSDRKKQSHCDQLSRSAEGRHTRDRTRTHTTYTHTHIHAYTYTHTRTRTHTHTHARTLPRRLLLMKANYIDAGVQCNYTPPPQWPCPGAHSPRRRQWPTYRRSCHSHRWPLSRASAVGTPVAIVVLVSCRCDTRVNGRRSYLHMY